MLHQRMLPGCCFDIAGAASHTYAIKFTNCTVSLLERHRKVEEVTKATHEASHNSLSRLRLGQFSLTGQAQLSLYLTMKEA